MPAVRKRAANGVAKGNGGRSPKKRAMRQVEQSANLLESESDSSEGSSGSSGSVEDDVEITEKAMVKRKHVPTSFEPTAEVVYGGTISTHMSEITDSSKREIKKLTEENRKLRMQLVASNPREKKWRLDPVTVSNIRAHVNQRVFRQIKFMKGMEMKVMQDLMVNCLFIPKKIQDKFLATYMANLRNNVDEARQNVQKVARIKFLGKLKTKKF